MAVTLFELLAKLTLDTKDFDKNVNTSVSKAGGITKSLEGMTARAVAMGNAMYNMGANAAKAAWNFGIDLIETAAEVQAEQAQFASVFEGVEDQAWDVFNRVGSMANIHTGRLMSLGTGVYTQFRSAGMDSAEAMTAMEETLSLAADAAAFYDISLEDATHMVKSFLRGNVEAGESIGLFANDALRTTYAMEMYGEKWAKLGELQKEAVLLAIAQDTYENAQATGQAAREADNYTNVLNNLKETWRQIKAIIGEPILNAIVPVLKEFEKFLNENPEVVEAFADAIGTAANWLKDMIVGALEYISEHKEEILGFLTMAGKFLGIIPGNKVIDSRSDEAVAMAEEVTVNRQRELEEGFAALVNAASTPGKDDDEAAAATWGKLLQQGYMESTTYNTALELLDAITQYGLDIFGEGTTPEDIIDRINEAETPAEMEQNLDDLLNTVFDQNGELITAVNGLPGAISAALNGITVQMDGATVGHLVAPTVMGVMARNSRDSRYTGGANA